MYYNIGMESLSLTNLAVLNKFQREGITIAEAKKIAKKIDLDVLDKIISYAKVMYFDTQSPVLEDSIYDVLIDVLSKRDPKNKNLTEVGISNSSQETVKLPYFLGSMDKVKPDTDAIEKWNAKQIKKHGEETFNYSLSAKLDGTSALLFNSRVKDDIRSNKLYTRGSGSKGKDITRLLKHLVDEDIIVNLHKNFNKYYKNNYEPTDNIAIRGEVIMTNPNLEKFNAEFGESIDKARNLTNGLVTRKTMEEKAQATADLTDFMAYEIVYPRMKKEEQYKLLSKLGFKLAKNEIVEEISNEILSAKLIDYKSKLDYDIDGIIIETNTINPVNKLGNPDYAIAFKMTLSDDIVEVEVKDVLWEASKHGVIKPRVVFDKIFLSGAYLQHATAFNAKYIKENNIGKGTIIKICRSGDVIPFIKEVVKPTKALLPDVEYSWSESNVDIIIANKKESKEVNINIMINFFSKLNIENISKGIITKLYGSGYKSILSILEASVEDFLKLEGFKSKLANKIHSNIQNGIKDVKPEIIMAASNEFGQGFGERKMRALLDVYPNIYEWTKEPYEIVEMVEEVAGFNTKTATKFAENLPRFQEFMKEHPMITIADIEDDDLQADKKDSKLNGLTIVMTGFRDKDLKSQIESDGGKVTDTISKNTNILITKEADASSTKVTKAEKLGIRVMDKQMFIEEFFN